MKYLKILFAFTIIVLTAPIWMTLTLLFVSVFLWNEIVEKADLNPR